MKRTIVIAAALAAAPAFAQMAEIDTDGDGAVTLDEMTTAYPDATQETFDAIDTNVDGTVDEAELTAAIDAGLVAPPGG